MEEYSDRRSKTEIAFRRRGSGFSYRNQSPEERTNHNSDGLGSSTRLNPMETGVTDNQERPRYLHDSFKSSSSKVVPASSSKFPLRKFEEKRRQPLSAGVEIAESGRRKAVAKQLEGSKKIVVDDETSDTLHTESEGFTTEQCRLLTAGSEGSHFAGPSGVSAHRAESLVRTASLSSRTHRQKEKELNLGTPGACSSSFTNRSTMPGNSTTGVRPTYGHVSGVQRRGLKNLGCTSVPDVQPSGCSSDSVYSRRFEFMRKRASDPGNSSRSRSFSGPSNLGHSPPTDIHDTGPRIRMNEQPLSQQIIRRSSRNQQEPAVSVRTRRPSPHATTLRVPDGRADSMLSLHESSTRNGQSAQEHLSLEEVSAESSVRPSLVELPHDIYSFSRRHSSNTRAERGRPSSLFEESPPQMFHGLMGERDGHRRITMGGIAEVLLALQRNEQEAELAYEQQLLVLETNLFLGAFASHDRHRDMRMDIDNMSYEELLALEERIGSVSTALSDEQFAKCLRRSIYYPVATGVNKSVIDDMKCSICQEDYNEGEEVGQLPCEHRYHVCCISQWLRQKNWCPVCKASAVPSTG
ncbi:hypothetical protein BAE44_0021794 [Dichanthelium oligosanthes]|uniref:RING-type E3 ubiquitin transferase n=1 Tax=Dichanthelium oligosanthes TaxID=888268 RepID=A0A1E5UWM8_9POAL|nr:hypothetical protein BAE44_0021794 [Dichanthelium oligosanthes]